MRLKSFTANSLPEALRRVRDVLGPDAIILSSQPAERGTGVRVTAALEDSPLEHLSHGGPHGDPGGDPGGDPRGTGVSIAEITEALAYHRVPPGLFDRLVGAAAVLTAKDDSLALGGALDNELTFATLPEARTPRPLLLAGPPGAGKTATAAKLCARVHLAGGRANLITMDTIKSGGLAQVTAFTEALGAELLQAPDIDALGDAVSACSPDRFVVIDTVGVNPYDGTEMERLSLAMEAAGAETVVVLPAGGDAAESAETAMAFAEAGATSLIATKIDAARRYGGILGAAQAGKLGLMAASASPQISEALLPFNPVSLARLLLPAAAGYHQQVPFREAG